MFESGFILIGLGYVIIEMYLMDVGTGPKTGKTVAIIVGGAAGVGFLVICLLFARSLMKKHDGMLFRTSMNMM